MIKNHWPKDPLHLSNRVKAVKTITISREFTHIIRKHKAAEIKLFHHRFVVPFICCCSSNSKEMCKEWMKKKNNWNRIIPAHKMKQKKITEILLPKSQINYPTVNYKCVFCGSFLPLFTVLLCLFRANDKIKNAKTEKRKKKTNRKGLGIIKQWWMSYNFIKICK